MTEVYVTDNRKFVVVDMPADQAGALRIGTWNGGRDKERAALIAQAYIGKPVSLRTWQIKRRQGVYRGFRATFDILPVE